MAPRVTDRRQYRNDFADLSFVARPIAEIGRNRCSERAGILFDGISQSCQVAASLLQGGSAFARKRRRCPSKIARIFTLDATVVVPTSFMIGAPVMRT